MPSRPEAEARVREACAKAQTGYSIDERGNVRDRGGFVRTVDLTDVLIAIGAEHGQKYLIDAEGIIYRDDGRVEYDLHEVGEWKLSCSLSGQSDECVAYLAALLTDAKR
jgi:hypothetical protein